MPDKILAIDGSAWLRPERCSWRIPGNQPSAEARPLEYARQFVETLFPQRRLHAELQDQSVRKNNPSASRAGIAGGEFALAFENQAARHPLGNFRRLPGEECTHPPRCARADLRGPNLALEESPRIRLPIQTSVSARQCRIALLGFQSSRRYPYRGNQNTFPLPWRRPNPRSSHPACDRSPTDCALGRSGDSRL